MASVAPVSVPVYSPPASALPSGSGTPVASASVGVGAGASAAPAGATRVGAGAAAGAVAAPEDVAANTVNFICQRCKLPMRIDATLLDLTADRFNTLADPALRRVPGAPEQAKSAQDSPLLGDVPVRRVVNRGQEEVIEPPAAFYVDDTRMAEADSFVLVGQPVPNTVKSQPAHRAKVAAKLFDLLTTRTTIDHPLCEDCNLQLQTDVKEAIKEADSERAAYQAFLATEAAQTPDPNTVAQMEGEIAELHATEQQLLADLERLATEQEQLHATAQELEREAADVRALEEQYWRDLNVFQEEQEAFQNERDSLVRKHSYTTEQLARLRKTSVYDEVFRIWHDGPFGTINNCRLGRLPGQLVDWAEINAAWGQALLLLHTLARKLHFEFTTYKLVPGGSFSRIERTAEPRASFELFGSGEYRAFFRNSQKFDNAMIGFLDCLNQLITYAKAADSTFKIPFEISADRVGEFSIKYNLDTNWTRALKYTLINLKWLMAWVSRHTS